MHHISIEKSADQFACVFWKLLQVSPSEFKCPHCLHKLKKPMPVGCRLPVKFQLTFPSTLRGILHGKNLSRERTMEELLMPGCGRR
jgi:hypothetical protein